MIRPRSVEMNNGFGIVPIGVVESEITDTHQMPLQGVRARIKIYQQYVAGLEGLEENSHIFVICWLHQAAREPLKVRPRKAGPDQPLKGVFALRSPVRPNPIALCPTKLISRKDNFLEVDPLDVIDGTPVIDLKPYSSGWDCIFSARGKDENVFVREMPAPEALQRLLREAANFHGEICVGVAIGTRIAYAAALRLGSSLKQRDIKIECRTKACVADAVQALSGATNKRFTHRPPEKGESLVVFEGKDISVELLLTAKKLESVEEALAIPEEELFRRRK